MHGLRRSFKSLAEWVEMPTGIVAQVMGHKPSATAEKHYTVRPLDLLRIWHSRYEAWILEQSKLALENRDLAEAALVTFPELIGLPLLFFFSSGKDNFFILFANSNK